jgi:hypothetical protein
MADDQPGIKVPDVGIISAEPFAYEVAARALEHQLERFRDVLTLSLGLFAAALAGVAFMVVDNATHNDRMVAVALAIGGFVAFLAFFCWSDPSDAPNPKKVAELYDKAPMHARAFSTGAVLLAINENRPHLRIKFLLAKLALCIIIVASTFGVCLKVVESGRNGQVRVPTRRVGFSSYEPRGKQPGGDCFPFSGGHFP